MIGCGNLLDYVSWRGDLPLDKYPLNEADWLLFSRLSYSPFTWLYLDEEDGTVTLGELMATMLRRIDLHEHIRKQEDLELYALLRDSIRYKDLEIGGFTDIFDVEKEIQFSAYTIRVMEDLYGLIFRGTDDTMVGVKEDLNMTFQCPVEAQTMALAYFNEFAEAHAGNYVLCGHSKGGNLAAYAASFCPYDRQDSIVGVYNFDGPGFDEMVLVTPQYQNICDRLYTYIPQASLVGVLLGHHESPKIIHSNAQQMAGQHNMYTWEIAKDHFLYEGNTTSASRYIRRTMQEWLDSMEKKQRERFVEAVYDVITRCEVRTFSDLGKHWLTNSVSILKEIKDLDEETRGIIIDGFGLLIKSARESIKLREEEEEEKRIEEMTED